LVADNLETRLMKICYRVIMLTMSLSLSYVTQWYIC